MTPVGLPNIIIPCGSLKTETPSQEERDNLDARVETHVQSNVSVIMSWGAEVVDDWSLDVRHSSS